MSDRVSARVVISQRLVGVRPYDQAAQIIADLLAHGYHIVHEDDAEEAGGDRLDYFAVSSVRFGARGNVREPLDPYLRLELLSTDGLPATLRLTFRGALDLVQSVSSALISRTQRADINAALGRTAPLSTEEVIAHERGT